jgi:hypothetical protein
LRSNILKEFGERPETLRSLLQQHKLEMVGHVLTEIGKRASEIGVPLGYHNHMTSLGESPDEIDRIMAAADPGS